MTLERRRRDDIEIYSRLTRVESSCEGIPDIKKKVDDIHMVVTAANLNKLPERVLTLEKKQWWISGGAAAIVGLFTLITLILKML